MEMSSKRYEMVRLFENLARAWTEERDRERQLEEFPDTHEPPETPQRFDGIDELADYSRQYQEYKDLHEGYEQRLRDARSQLQRAKGEVMSLLPEGIPLVFSYQSHGAGPVGKTFRVVKVRRDTPEIDIEELPSE